MDLKASQAPLKDRYREDPSASRVTLHADGGTTEGPVACSVDIGRAIYEAEAHGGVGGPGTGACSGDLLLGALAACAQITCQMVAANMEIPVRDIAASVEGDLDLRGTLGVARDAPVGFEAIRLRLRIDAPDATDEQIASVVEKTERYCTVLQTLRDSPMIELATSDQ